MNNKIKYKIAVCGQANGELIPDIISKAQLIGSEIAKIGSILITGGTSGYPQAAAQGTINAGGISVGISPAANRDKHQSDFKLPFDEFDPMIYTGLGFKSRNVVLVQSADAVIFISGGTGTLNEFTVAYDEKKIIGVLKDSGGVENMISIIIENNYKPPPPIIFESDPQKLVSLLLQKLQAS